MLDEHAAILRYVADKTNLRVSGPCAGAPKDSGYFNLKGSDTATHLWCDFIGDFIYLCPTDRTLWDYQVC